MRRPAAFLGASIATFAGTRLFSTSGISTRTRRTRASARRTDRHFENGAVVSAEPDTDQVTTDEQLAWLVATHGTVLYRVAFAVTHDRDLAEEVVQDALFQAWTAMPSWEGNTPIKWMRRVTRNRAISVMRTENRTDSADDWEQRIADQPETERLVEARQTLAAMNVALSELDESSRVMLVLRETEGTSYEELAELLDLTPSAVKAKLYRARHALKRRLREWDT